MTNRLPESYQVRRPTMDDAEVVSDLYKRGRRKVGLGVDSQNLTGATRLYERAGMHVARQYISYQKELRAGKEPSTQTIAV